MDKLGSIHQHHWKERLNVSKIDKFESDMQDSQIRQIWCILRQIWRILRQNCSDYSTEVTEGVTLTPEIFGYKHSFVLTFFATNTIYINCKQCKP